MKILKSPFSLHKTFLHGIKLSKKEKKRIFLEAIVTFHSIFIFIFLNRIFICSLKDVSGVHFYIISMMFVSCWCRLKVQCIIQFKFFLKITKQQLMCIGSDRLVNGFQVRKKILNFNIFICVLKKHLGTDRMLQTSSRVFKIGKGVWEKKKLIIFFPFDLLTFKWTATNFLTISFSRNENNFLLEKHRK